MYLVVQGIKELKQLIAKGYTKDCHSCCWPPARDPGPRQLDPNSLPTLCMGQAEHGPRLPAGLAGWDHVHCSATGPWATSAGSNHRPMGARLVGRSWHLNKSVASLVCAFNPLPAYHQYTGGTKRPQSVPYTTLLVAIHRFR